MDFSIQLIMILKIVEFEAKLGSCQFFIEDPTINKNSNFVFILHKKI